jgi:hypothetical protein
MAGSSETEMSCRFDFVSGMHLVVYMYHNHNRAIATTNFDIRPQEQTQPWDTPFNGATNARRQQQQQQQQQQQILQL